MASSKTKTKEYNKKFRFNDEQLEYDFQIRKRRRWWWLLLLLLPLLLLIRWERDITVHVGRCDGSNVENASVRIYFTEYQLLKDGKFFYEADHIAIETTDVNGLATFTDQPTGVYDWLFHHRKKIIVDAEKDGMSASVEDLFHRCNRTPIEVRIGSVTVHIIDKETEDDVPNARIRWKSGDEGNTVGDEHGIAHLDGVDCNSSLEWIEVKADGYADTLIEGRVIDDIMLSDSAFIIRLRPVDVNYTCDIVMCIDNTGSMAGVINTVKRNIVNFQRDLTDYCARNGRKIKSSRVKVISFGDLMDCQMRMSDFFTLPGEESALSTWVNNIQMSPGGNDGPEDALEAMALAFQSEWNNEGTRRRQIVIVYTDADAHKLGFRKSFSFYPTGMPDNFDQLSEKWNSMSRQTKRLVLFTETRLEPWDKIDETWECVTRKKAPLSTVFSGSDYTDVLKTICESL